jgi:hypothetical protein
MDRAGVDALIVYGDREGTGPAPFAPDTWFTNDRPGSIVVVPRHAEPIAPVMFPMAVADHIAAVVVTFLWRPAPGRWHLRPPRQPPPRARRIPPATPPFG